MSLEFSLGTHLFSIMSENKGKKDRPERKDLVLIRNSSSIDPLKISTL